MKTYSIRYNHTQEDVATSKAAALQIVADKAVQVRGSKTAAKDLVAVEVDDGTYVYLDQASADRDDTGARAFAVISAE